MHPQTRTERAVRPQARGHPPLSYAQEDPCVLEVVPTYGTYRLDVPIDPEARLAAFTAFVRRALERARVGRGWSVEKVAREAGIGVNTLYLWRSAEWKQFPKGELVEAFCDALGIPPAAAYAILWPGKNERPAEPEPLGAEPDLIILARRLADPSVPEQEKYLIRETIRGLASRPSPPGDTTKRKNAS